MNSPPVAVAVLLATMFFRLSLPNVGIDPFLLAYAGVLASIIVWRSGRRGAFPRPGAAELAMVLFILWNLGSMILPHEYPPSYPLFGTEIPVLRLIVIGTVIPFTLYLVGRTAFESRSAVRFILWSVLALAAYSTTVSIFQFHAPSLVWPRYIVDAPNWVNRAVGVLNQPVGNGTILIVGFVIALVLASDREEPAWRRAGLRMYAVVTTYAIFLTHTRAAYLGFALVLMLGTVLARGYRSGFTLTSIIVTLLAALNWTTFTSADRAAGGVGSQNELWDRLNVIATAIWASHEKPWLGWGVGRFAAVNTYHHQQWSNDVPWRRGWGITSHVNELGILVELGLLGLVLWLSVLVPIVVLLSRAYRDLPVSGLTGQRLAFIGITALTAQLVAGSSVDLRLLEFPTAVVLLLAGLAVGERDRRADPA